MERLKFGKQTIDVDVMHQDIRSPHLGLKLSSSAMDNMKVSVQRATRYVWP